ncbi:GIY-YIG nuclease family protein [Sphingobacterium sp.]|uniref:GIY-YIG nuclease family protein n=1 Tax=Sphingobacterium sp. TaxID=341027 RepID=UPI0028B102A2|nr:GIY-YIG nuclease family protein [Sphingobacterium sp.]
MYYVYILTNSNRTVLYVGVTNDLKVRLTFHKSPSLSHNSFTNRYKVYFLIYFETFSHVLDAITREKEIKRWTRKRKEELINTQNKEWKFLNDMI